MNTLGTLSFVEEYWPYIVGGVVVLVALIIIKIVW